MISLLCPTRGRPDNMRRFAESVNDTRGLTVEIVWYVDSDDDASVETARALLREGLRSNIISGPRLILSQYWNRCMTAAAGDVLGCMADDIVFRTPGWDLAVTDAFEAFPDRICFVHGSDGWTDSKVIGTHGFLHRNWVHAVGYFIPPYFAHDYADTWLTDVSDELDRRVQIDILTEHMHWLARKAHRDQTYAEHDAAGAATDVRGLYESLALERRADAAKLRAVMR